jgi:hypothetical protein
MELVRSSDTSVLTKATWPNIQKDGILYSHRRESLKSYIVYPSSSFCVKGRSRMRWYKWCYNLLFSSIVWSPHTYKRLYTIYTLSGYLTLCSVSHSCKHTEVVERNRPLSSRAVPMRVCAPMRMSSLYMYVTFNVRKRAHRVAHRLQEPYVLFLT